MSTVASLRVLRRISNEVADRFSPGCGDLVTCGEKSAIVNSSIGITDFFFEPQPSLQDFARLVYSVLN